MILWGIEYTLKMDDKWSRQWTGPCGVYSTPFDMSPELADILRGRPFLYRTRKQAVAACQKSRKDIIKYRPVCLEVTITRKGK